MDWAVKFSSTSGLVEGTGHLSLDQTNWHALKRIDVPGENAAADPRMALEKTSAADWDRLFARNLRAYFWPVVKRLVLWLGRFIINLASITFHNSPATWRLRGD